MKKSSQLRNAMNDLGLPIQSKVTLYCLFGCVIFAIIACLSWKLDKFFCAAISFNLCAPIVPFAFIDCRSWSKRLMVIPFVLLSMLITHLLCHFHVLDLLKQTLLLFYLLPLSLYSCLFKHFSLAFWNSWTRS